MIYSNSSSMLVYAAKCPIVWQIMPFDNWLYFFKYCFKTYHLQKLYSNCIYFTGKNWRKEKNFWTSGRRDKEEVRYDAFRQEEKGCQLFAAGWTKASWTVESLFWSKLLPLQHFQLFFFEQISREKGVLQFYKMRRVNGKTNCAK